MTQKRDYSFVLFVLSVFLFTTYLVSAQTYVALQGNVLNSTGSALSSGNLRVVIFDSAVGGSEVYNSTTDFNGAIVNGKYDVLLGNGSNALNLEYGKQYYLAIFVNGENFSYNGSQRQLFQSSVGQINTSYVNQTSGSSWFGLGLDTILNLLGAKTGWTTSGNTIYNSTVTSVGIGTANPVQKLDVRGSVNVSGTIYIGNTTDIATFLYNQTTPAINYLNTTYGNLWYNHTAAAQAYAEANFLRIDGDNGTGRYQFDGGWQNGGVTIDQGNLYAQALFVYNITSLQVSHLNTNGSFIPIFNNTFSLGNATRAWSEGHFATDVYVGGIAVKQWLYNQTAAAPQYWATNGTAIYNSTAAQVGIGTNSPTASLEIKGNLSRSRNLINFSSSDETSFLINSPSSTEGSNISLIGGRGNVGGSIYIQSGAISDSTPGYSAGDIILKTSAGGPSQAGGSILLDATGGSLSSSQGTISLSAGQGISFVSTNVPTSSIESNTTRYSVFGSEFVKLLAVPSSSNTSNYLQLSANGKIIFNSSGTSNLTVGIGTSNPSQTLDVRGTGNFSGTIFINNVTDLSTLRSLWATNGTAIYNSTVAQVGIGTSSPTAKLTVEGEGGLATIGVGASATGNQSIALGSSSTASGANSFAIGSNATAVNTNNFAIGPNTRAREQLQQVYNTTSFAIGINSSAVGGVGASGRASSISIGVNTSAGSMGGSIILGTDSASQNAGGISLGRSNVVGGSTGRDLGIGSFLRVSSTTSSVPAIALGDTINVSHSGSGALAVGTDLEVQDSISFGRTSTSLNNSVVVGTNNHANYGIALGRNQNISGFGSLALGDTINISGTNSAGFGQGLHITGNNSFGFNTGLNGVQVISQSQVIGFFGGNVGIGTGAPSQTLDVRGAGNFSSTIYINNQTDIFTRLSPLATNNNNIFNLTVSQFLLGGAGLSFPSARLYVFGNTVIDNGTLNVRGSGNFSGTIFINNATDISTLGGGSGPWVVSGTTIYNSTVRRVNIGNGSLAAGTVLFVNSSQEADRTVAHLTFRSENTPPADVTGLFVDIRANDGCAACIDVYGTNAQINVTSANNVYGSSITFRADENTGNVYGYFVNYITTGVSNRYGIYASGENYNYLSGKLGIGTAITPTYALHVGGDAAINNTLFVMQNGRVGIGNSTPAYRLVVQGNASFNNTLFVNSNGSVRIGASEASNNFAKETNDLYIQGDLEVDGSINTGGSVGITHTANILDDNSVSCTMEFVNGILTSSSCTGSCFLPGTKITMEDGSLKNIEDVLVNETIRSYNRLNGDLVNVPVRSVMNKIVDAYYVVEFDDGSQIKVTDNHPLFTQEREWASINPNASKIENPTLHVEQLRVGDHVKRQYGWKQITGWMRVEGQVRVYNLNKVGLTAAFFADDTLAHNKCVKQGTLIATPLGLRAIETLEVGELVYGQDAFGNRVATPILRTFKKEMLEPIPGKILSNGAVVTWNHIITIDGKKVIANDTELQDTTITTPVYDLETTSGNYYVEDTITWFGAFQ